MNRSMWCHYSLCSVLTHWPLYPLPIGPDQVTWSNPKSMGEDAIPPTARLCKSHRFITVRERIVGNNNLIYHNVSIIVFKDFIRQEGTEVKFRWSRAFSKIICKYRSLFWFRKWSQARSNDRLITGSRQFFLDTASLFFLHPFLISS